MADLVEVEDGAVHAHVFGADVAPSADADAALHALFEGCEDLAVFEFELLQPEQHELDHDGRAAHDGDAVVGGGGLLGEHRRNESHPLFPAGEFLVHRQHHFRPPRFPVFEFVTVAEVHGRARPVDQGDVPVPLPLSEKRQEQGAERRHADAAGDEEDVLPLHGFNREGISEWRPHAQLVPHRQLMEPLGHFAHPHDAELEIVFARGGRVDHEGGLAHPENRELAHLARLERELPHLFRVVKREAQRADIGRLLDHLSYRSQFRAVGIKDTHRDSPSVRPRPAVCRWKPGRSGHTCRIRCRKTGRRISRESS